MTDILDAIAEFRAAFQTLDLDPPVSITLSTHEAGMKLLCRLYATPYLIYYGGAGKPVEHPDGSVWVEIEVVGMKIRWPGNKYARQNGDFVWG